MAENEVVKVGRTGFRDIPLNQNLINRTRDGDPANGRANITLTEALEEIDPSEEYKNDALASTDAFERQLIRFGIRVSSNHARGIYASKMAALMRDETRYLLPEFLSRIWKAVSADASSYEVLNKDTGERFYQSNAPISDVLYPEALSNIIRQKQIAPTLPLSLLVAVTTPVDSETYTPHRLTDDEDERTLRRVAEGTELPTAILTGADFSVKMKKYGRALRVSYETLRRMAIDRIALHLALLAAQAEVDKVRTALDVLVNGDGSAGSAATNTNISTLDALAGAGVEPTAKGYLGWRMLWAPPYNCNVIVSRNEGVIQLMFANVGSANVLLGQLQGALGIGGLQLVGDQVAPVKVAWDNVYAPADKWLGIDNRYALEQVVEIGAEIVETDKLISNQMNLITFSESLAWAIWDTNGVVRTLTLNA